MKFEVVLDKGNNLYCWVLASNAGDIIASSPITYPSQEKAEAAIKDFKTWVRQAPLEFVTREVPKDWKEQAKQQLRKQWTKA